MANLHKGPTKAYKLLSLRRDNTMGPLFINKDLHVEVGKWYEAEDHPTKGFAHRPGFHVCSHVAAPHLKMGGRVWCEVEIEDYEILKRPAAQGGTWFLANRMRVTRRTRRRHKNRFD